MAADGMERREGSAVARVRRWDGCVAVSRLRDQEILMLGERAAKRSCRADSECDGDGGLTHSEVTAIVVEQAAVVRGTRCAGGRRDGGGRRRARFV